MNGNDIDVHFFRVLIGGVNLNKTDTSLPWCELLLGFLKRAVLGVWRPLSGALHAFQVRVCDGAEDKQ